MAFKIKKLNPINVKMKSKINSQQHEPSERRRNYISKYTY